MTKKNLIFALLMVATLGSFAYAQKVVVLTPDEAKPVGGTYTADDTVVAMLVRYVGTNAGGGEVTVNADGTITFTVATSADTTFECPVTGGLGGIIDVTNGACNTAGEVCDVINGLNGAGGSTTAAPSDFRCVLINALRSDNVNNTLLAKTIATADSADGLALQYATADGFAVTVGAGSLAMLPPEAKKISFYLGPGPAYSLKPFPFANQRTYVTWAWEDSSTCTGADTFRILAANDYTPGSETVQTLYGPIPTNTTTAVEFTQLANNQIFGNFGAKVILREACASSLVGLQISGSGYQVTRGAGQ